MFELVKVIIVVLMVLWILQTIFGLVRWVTLDNSKMKVLGVIFLTIETILICFYFFVFSIEPNSPIPPQTQLDSHAETILESKELPSSKQLAVDVEKKTNKYLKRIDEGPEKDRVQADQYLKQALKEAKKGASK